MILLALAVSPAWAVEPPPLNAQLFHTSVDGRTGLSLDDAIVAPDGHWNARTLLQYVNDPLVFVTTDGEEMGGLEDVVAMNLLGGYTWRGLRVGADLPVYPWAGGALVDSGVLLGDLALDARYTVLDPDIAPVGLAPTVRVALPTAGERAPLGARGFDGVLGLATSQRYAEWSVAGNAGVHLVPGVRADDVAWGSRLDVRVGGARDLGTQAGVTGELSLATVFARLGEGGAVPAEAMLGGWYRLPRDLVLRGGVGTGLSRAIGTPDARLVLAASWEPSLVRDRDRDGFLDRVDGCPAVAEDIDGFKDADGCPDLDNDEDGIADAVDRCALVAEDRDGFEDENGCPDEDNDGDTLLDTVDGCPVEAEDRDGYLDADGCPDPLTRVRAEVLGAGGVGLRDARVALGEVAVAPGATIERQAGPVVIVASAVGYKERSLSFTVVNGPEVLVSVELEAIPVPAPSPQEKVVVSRDRIDFYEKIYFDTNKASIKKQSFAILDAIAAALVAHPEVARVRVEGHTDDVGDAAKNLRLSEGRAAAVRAYLVKKGVAEAHLVSVGRGEERPVDPAKTVAAREKNRRVELLIEERTP